MNRLLLSLLAGALIVLAGCGGGGGGGGDDNSGDNGNNNGTPGTKLGLYTEQVKTCTPYLNKGSLSAGTSNLADWNSWNPGASSTVLGKLFDPANGKDECIYNQVQVLDSHIGMVNQFSDHWLTSGVYSKGNITATVDTTVSTVTIPFIGSDSDLKGPLDRLVTLSVPDQNLTIHMAFSQNGGNQTIVEQYVIGNTQSGAYLALIEGSVVRIWHAGITGSKVQFQLVGNSNEKSFKISECTNAAGGNWEVMGGGSIASPASEMAFMARNDQNNNSSDSDTYYMTTTLSGLENSTLQPIINVLATPPDPNTDSVQAYITEGNDSCIRFFGMGQYPNTLEDLAWVQ